MNEAEVYAAVKGILMQNFAVPVDKIAPDAQFRGTYGMDSLDIVDLVFFLRQTFGVTDEMDDYRELHTTGKLVAFILRHVESQPDG